MTIYNSVESEYIHYGNEASLSYGVFYTMFPKEAELTRYFKVMVTFASSSVWDRLERERRLSKFFERIQ
jgi:hypothetical protein